MIEVLYTCKRCGTVKRSVRVRARAETEELRIWIDLVRTAVGDNHSQWSPFCTSRECDLMIPVPANAPYFGADPIRH